MDDQVRATATRSQTVASIRDAGFHRKFNMDNAFLQSLVTYFETLNGGNKPPASAKSMASVISRYLYFHNKNILTSIDITDKQKISRFINQFKASTTASASTIINTLNALKGASAYMSSLRLPRIDSHQKVSKCIDRLKASLRTAHMQRKTYNRRHRLVIDCSTPDLVDAPAKIKAFGHQIEQILACNQITNEERNTVTSYLIVRLAVENCARSSHITNLQLSEFSEGEQCGEEYICTCTFSKNGLAPVVFSREMLAFTRRYINHIRPEIPNASVSGRSTVFLSNNGTRLKNVSSQRHLYKVLKLASVTQCFNLTQLRKAATTQASRMFADNPGQLALFNRYLCHSQAVADQYYTEALRNTEYQRGFQLIQHILS